MNQTVVVHTANGSQGAAVARVLRSDGWTVTPLSRTASEGAAGVDLRDLDALSEAHRGADAAVVQLPLVFDPEVIDQQVDNIVRAVATAQVARVVVNTNAPIPPQEIGLPFVDGRVRLAARLRDAVETVSVVAPLFAYMENLQIPSSRDRINGGELAYPVPADYAMPWVATDDLAEVVATVLASPSPPAQQVVAGPEALRGEAAAAQLSEALGHPVRWVTIDHADYEAMLIPHLGAEAGAGIASFYAAPPADADPSATPGLVHGRTTLGSWASSQRWS
jgi:hypothetical protein